MTKLQVDEGNRIKICFMAFDACIFGFHECCRPAIAIDGTQMKEKYNEILFIVTAMDSNDKIFPIAFRIGYFENDRC